VRIKLEEALTKAKKKEVKPDYFKFEAHNLLQGNVHDVPFLDCLFSADPGWS